MMNSVENGGAQHEAVVTVERGGDEVLADAGQREHLLDHQRAGEQVARGPARDRRPPASAPA